MNTRPWLFPILLLVPFAVSAMFGDYLIYYMYRTFIWFHAYDLRNRRRTIIAMVRMHIRNSRRLDELQLELENAGLASTDEWDRIQRSRTSQLHTLNTAAGNHLAALDDDLVTIRKLERSISEARSTFSAFQDLSGLRYRIDLFDKTAADLALCARRTESLKQLLQ